MKRKKHNHEPEMDIFACENCKCIHLRADDMDVSLTPEQFLWFRDRVNEIAFHADRQAVLHDRQHFLRHTN